MQSPFAQKQVEALAAALARSRQDTSQEMKPSNQKIDEQLQNTILTEFRKEEDEKDDVEDVARSVRFDSRVVKVRDHWKVTFARAVSDDAEDFVKRLGRCMHIVGL